MKFDVKDYVVIEVNGKNAVAQIKKIKKDSCIVVVNGKHLISKEDSEGMTFKIPQSDVKCNLFNEPAEGKVFGIKTDVYRRSKYIRPWGNIHYFRDVTESEEKKLTSSLKWMSGILGNYGLDYKLPIDIEVRPKDGKWAGSYLFNGEKSLDVMTFHPKALTDLKYVVAHETGHHLEYRHMTEQQKREWLELYHSSVAVQEISLDTIRSYRKDLVKSKNVKDFKKELEQEDRVVFNGIIKHMKQIHRVSDKDIKVLLEEGDNLKDYWPNKSLDISNVELQVSDYGKKNVNEYFAEAFSFHLTEREIPKPVRQLLKSHLSYFMSENTDSKKKAA